MEWERGEILEELGGYFSKKFYDEEKTDEEIVVLDQEILNTLNIDTPFENSGSVTVDGTEYRIIQDEDEAVRIATEQVKNDLEEDPTMFTQSWLQNYIFIGETDKRCMVADEEDFIREMVTEDAESVGFTEDIEKEQWIESTIEERLKDFEDALEDPINYFVEEQGVYTIEDLMSQNWINIDIEEASKEAVQIDGWSHFLSHYDGNYEETENGLIIFREC